MGSEDISQGKKNLWQRLRRRDKVLVVILLPIWLFSLIMHVDLALDDQLVRPAILFNNSSLNGEYPVVGTIMREAQAMVDESGIQLGDELLSINGRSMQDISGFRAGLIATSYLGNTDQIAATFRRGQQTFNREYPFNDFGIPRWWPSLFAISFGVVGLLILLSGPRSRTAQAIFPAFTFFSLSWLVVLGHSELQTIIGLILFGASMVFAGPLVLRAILLLPENTAIQSKFVHRSVWIFSLMLISGFSAFTGYPFSSETGQGMHLALMALFYLSILLLLARNYIKADKIGRRQLRWVILGFYFAFVPAMGVTAFVILYPDQFSLYALSSIGMPIVPIMFLVAITRYNLFDIDRLIGRSVSYSILIILIAVLTEAVIEPLVAVIGTQYGFDGNNVQLLFVGALTAVLIPAQKKWRPTINRIFFAQGVAVEDTVSELIDKVDTSESMTSGQVFNLVGEDLSKAYELSQWGVFQCTDGSLSLINGEFTDDIPEFVIKKYEKRARPGAEAITSSKTCLVVPIRLENKLTWLLILGPKGSGDVYTTTDNGMIASLAFEIADKLQTD